MNFQCEQCVHSLKHGKHSKRFCLPDKKGLREDWFMGSVGSCVCGAWATVYNLLIKYDAPNSM